LILGPATYTKTRHRSSTVNVWTKGDLLGPSVNGLDKLIRMPYGCGEQNMLNFAPNIYIMKYLETADQMTADIADKSQRYMMAGTFQLLRMLSQFALISDYVLCIYVRLPDK